MKLSSFRTIYLNDTNYDEPFELYNLLISEYLGRAKIDDKEAGIGQTF